MKNQIFFQNFVNPMERPIHALMELNLKTLRNFSYFTPVELLSVKKPEEVLEKGMNAFIKNTQTSIDLFQNIFSVMESHFFHLNDKMENRIPVMNRPIAVSRAKPKAAAKRVAAKRAVATTAARKAVASKSVAKKASGTKSVAKKASGTRSVARKAIGTKSVARKAIGTKSVARKAIGTKSVARKAIGTKSVARKAISAKPVARKAIGAKPVARKAISTKSVAKKAVTSRSVAKKSVIAKQANSALRNNNVKSKSAVAKNKKAGVSMKHGSTTKPSTSINKDIKSNSYGYNSMTNDANKTPIKGMTPSHQGQGFNADRKPLINQEISKMNPISTKPFTK